MKKYFYLILVFSSLQLMSQKGPKIEFKDKDNRLWNGQ